MLVAASRDGARHRGARRVSDGGIAQALVEMALRDGVGATVAVPAGVDPFVLPALGVDRPRGRHRATRPTLEALAALAARARRARRPRIGVVTGPGDDLQVRPAYGGDVGLWTLDELRATADATLPALFG